MISIALQVLICGIATAAICRTIVYYEGPFHVFPRFRNWLLPKLDLPCNDYDIADIQDLQDQYSNILMAEQTSDGQREMWKTYHSAYNPEYYQSIRGTLHNLLDCPFCLGPYISSLMAFFTTLFVMVTANMLISAIIINWIVVSCGALGLHFIISKKWEQWQQEN